jgi:hypothetical protein
MKFSILKAAAVASVLVFGTAHADSIQVDLNADSVLSAAFDELKINYNSHTTVNVNALSANFGAVHTYAGYDLIGNTMGGILASGVYADFNEMSDYGYENSFNSYPSARPLDVEGDLSDSFLTFGVDLVGTLGAGGITYTSGTLNLWQGYTDGVTPAEQIMTADFQSGGVTAGNQDILSISGAADILKDGVMFLDMNGTPVSFKDYLTANPLSAMRLVIDQNVNGGAASLLDAINGDVNAGYKGNDGAGTVYVSAAHNASLTFNVPEPTTLAILGLGLLGFAGTRRKS